MRRVTDVSNENQGGEDQNDLDTVPPPAEGDLYSVATVVRKPPPEILEAARVAREKKMAPRPPRPAAAPAPASAKIPAAAEQKGPAGELDFGQLMNPAEQPVPSSARISSPGAAPASARIPTAAALATPGTAAPVAAPVAPVAHVAPVLAPATPPPASSSALAAAVPPASAPAVVAAAPVVVPVVAAVAPVIASDAAPVSVRSPLVPKVSSAPRAAAEASAAITPSPSAAKQRWRGVMLFVVIGLVALGAFLAAAFGRSH